MINLLSDTVTKPVPAMLEAMMSAEVGDDVFGEDPTINALEAKAAAMFGHEKALFCPSGTMTNQIAIKVHTQALDEVICDELSHIYRAEVGGYAFNSGIAIQLLPGNYGKINAEQIQSAIKADSDWLPRSSLVVLENTTNIGGGNYYTAEEIIPIRKLCQEKGLSLHLDGARIFNALVETGDSTRDTGALFDSLSICLSKGLGAPVGSLLIGNSEFIRNARRVRKVMGGGMRQAGILAAAGIFALDNHIDRLKTDHQHAKMLGTAIEKNPAFENTRPIMTNIVIFDVKAPHDSSSLLTYLKSNQINASAFGPRTIRLVTHLDISAEMIERTKEIIEKFK
ncbi:MAG: threonine aldolase family protein [Saprospiraceae bacterium]